MAEIRLSKLIKQFNIGLDTLVDHLNSLGASIENANPNMKVSDEFLPELHKKFGKDLELKEAAEKVDVKLTEILDKAAKKSPSEMDEEDEYEPEKVTVIKSNNLSRVDRPEPVAAPAPAPAATERVLSALRRVESPGQRVLLRLWQTPGDPVTPRTRCGGGRTCWGACRPSCHTDARQDHNRHPFRT